MTCYAVASDYDDAVEYQPPKPKSELILGGHATDHIWAMGGDGSNGEEITLRMDCGDAGFVTLSNHQAKEVIGTLQTMLAKSALQKMKSEPTWKTLLLFIPRSFGWKSGATWC